MSLFNLFQGKKVLITGHTGFKGSWLALWLNQLGAEVVGASIDVPSNPCHFDTLCLNRVINDNRIDINNVETIKELVIEVQPDFVFHLAAQALVKKSYASPLETLTTNSIGTANVLESLRSLSKPVVALMITSDKVYDNVEWIWGYRESDQLGGKDPYSASKGMAELAIRTYLNSFFNDEPNNNVRIGITRAGNVIGGGDWAQDRIVPDCMTAWAEDNAVDIRNPSATRPWQHVLEPLSGYISLAANLYSCKDNHGEAYNFGPPANQNYSVSQLINEMGQYWEKVRWNDVSDSKMHHHEAGLLKLNCDKALANLNWHPTLSFEETVRFTVEWYKSYYDNPMCSMYDFSLNQILQYTELSIRRSSNLSI